MCLRSDAPFDPAATTQQTHATCQSTLDNRNSSWGPHVCITNFVIYSKGISTLDCVLKWFIDSWFTTLLSCRWSKLCLWVCHLCWNRSTESYLFLFRLRWFCQTGRLKGVCCLLWNLTAGNPGDQFIQTRQWQSLSYLSLLPECCSRWLRCRLLVSIWILCIVPLMTRLKSN